MEPPRWRRVRTWTWLRRGMTKKERLRTWSRRRVIGTCLRKGVSKQNNMMKMIDQD
jgi:hypothetical protein